MRKINLHKFEKGDIVNIQFLDIEEMESKIGFHRSGGFNTVSNLNPEFWQFLRKGGKASVSCHITNDNNEDGLVLIDPFSKQEMAVYPDIVKAISIAKKSNLKNFVLRIHGYVLVAECLNEIRLGLEEDYFDEEDIDEIEIDVDDCPYQFFLSRENARELVEQLRDWLNEDPSVSPVAA